MEVVEALTWRGGVLEAALLYHLTSRRKVRTALENGSVLRVARGRFALPDSDESRRAAARLSGVVSHLSAAQLHGWELKHRPRLPTVTVPRHRRIEPRRRQGVDVKWRDLDEDEIWNGQTRAGRTVMDCIKVCPLDEGLTVADSALRHGNVTSGLLRRLADQVPTVGRRRCLRVAQEASGLSANPFESVLRAIALGVTGIDMRPQITIDEDGFVGRPDLVDVDRRIVAEADSFEFHGRRQALKRDCERYTALAVRGWIVLRFSWENVMFEPVYVADCFRRAQQARPQQHAAPTRNSRRSA
jgi:very-short-patch-repair endonuclease